MVALVVESWIWYAFVIAVAASRFISRWMTFGTLKRFEADDYLMLLALCFYTTLITTINIVAHTNSNLFPPGYDIEHMTKVDIDQRRYGSKLVLVVEQCQCCAIWLAKSCLLVMYLRLTTLRRENIAVKVLCGYVAFTFVFMEIFYLGVWCRPFHNYWAVPTPNTQCDAATNHLITNAVFNLTSDLAMLAIGLPMFIRTKLPLRKKIPLIGIFSLGIFVILAAILNKVYSFSQPFGSLWTYWYVRESSTALLVANLPFVWTFWRRVATGTGSVNGVSRQTSIDPSIALSRNEKQESTRRESKRRPSFPWAMYAGDLDPDGLEMGQKGKGRASGGLTLQQILSESNTDLTEGEEISPYTHPALFFARQSKTASNESLAVPKAVVSKGEHDLVRRDSGSDRRVEETTPVSSLFPGSFKSAGSFA